MSYQHTKQWIVDISVDKMADLPGIKEAAHLIQEGSVVAFPTETVYGLGGNARSGEAIGRIFAAKGRPSDNPLIVHIAEKEQLNEYVAAIPEKARKLMEAFWPGPLTIVLEHNGTLSDKVTAGLPTVAVRMPDHPVALGLLKAAGLPVAAPSANSSGKPSPTTAQHVYDDLAGRIAGIVDGGPTGVGVESTVVDCTKENVMILRPGGITKEDIEDVIGPVAADPALTAPDETPVSPGMKYTHYAPAAPLVLVEGGAGAIQAAVEEASAQGKRSGVLVTEQNSNVEGAAKTVVMGPEHDLSLVARRLYDSLRSFREEEVDIIFTQVFPETALGTAIMNRLRKAAGGRVIRPGSGKNE